MGHTCRILSIDGGGIRGILPARILLEIEKRTGRSIAETFNFIVGASTGGLLALGLGIPRSGSNQPYTAAEMFDFYQSKGPEIFSSSFWHDLKSRCFLGPRYGHSKFEAVLKELLGDKRLSECGDDVDLLIPAYEIEQRKAYFFKSCHAKNDPADDKATPAQRDFFARDIARAACAAPTYFAPAQVRNAAGERLSFIDGGVFANNPTLCAVVAARWLYPSAEHFCILSLGTGTLEQPIHYAEAKSWGPLRWARPVISAMMDGNAQTVDYKMREIAEAFAKKVITYHRFEINLPQNVDNDFANASPENIDALLELADDLLNLDDVSNGLNELIPGFKASPKTPRKILRRERDADTAPDHYIAHRETEGAQRVLADASRDLAVAEWPAGGRIP